MDVMTSLVPIQRLDRSKIETRIKSCARLPSLGSINSALRELLGADQRYTTQISEVIRRDPSLTARLLRLVNSVYFGLTMPVNNIEEAVFYLGVRQIRQLAMVTPVIEDFQKLAGTSRFPWREFWRHCIGTAIITREVTSSVQVPADETDYLAGLVHDVGKIIMASAFPQHFAEIHNQKPSGEHNLLDIETEILGLNHCELGGIYLRNHNLPPVLAEAAEYHHAPEGATHSRQVVAAVQVADLLVRWAKIGNSGNTTEVSDDEWMQTSGWSVLYNHNSEAERVIAGASLKRSLERLPVILEGLV